MQLVINRYTLLHVITSYDRGFKKKERVGEGSKERGEKEGETERERESLLPNEKRERRVEECKKVVGYRSRKHEEKKCIWTPQFFLYNCTSLP